MQGGFSQYRRGNRQKNKVKLFRSTFRVGSMTLLSRIFGFIRDVVLARVFGAGVAMDAFVVAFRIPNFMRRLFAEGSFSLAFVPVLSEAQEKGDRAAVRELIDHVTGALLSVLLLITAVGVLAAPWVTALFAPSWYLEQSAEYEPAVQMLRITFPYILFISLTALAGGILNTYERFLVPAATPILLNLSLISAALLFADRFDEPIMALAWGVFAAGVLQLLVQVPALVRMGLLPRPKWGWGHRGVRRILRLMGPTLVGSSVAQVNLFVDTVIATFLVSGSVSWLYFSDRLLEFPIGVFGVALATVILPNLSGKHAREDRRAFSRTIDWALRLTLFLTLPAMVGLAVLAQPIMTTLFQHGEFVFNDMRMAAVSLVAYASGLPAFIAVKALAPGFYARQDTRTPVKIAILAMFANMVLNLLLVWTLDHRMPGAHAGLALASAASAYLNAALLLKALRAQGVYHAEAGWWKMIVISIAAAVAMGTALWWMAGSIWVWQDLDNLGRVSRLAWVVAAGAAIYFAASFLFGLRPADLSRGSH